jgi:23S rRNA (guanosine2251-2'-O)-methyltransferase
MRQIIVIVHDMRSTHNVGSLLRTCEGLGVKQVHFSGYTPYPLASDDTRLPHETAKLTKQIQKTALGAENLVPWSHAKDIAALIKEIKADGYQVIALEQDEKAISLIDFSPPDKLAILLGREVEGIAPDMLALCDQIIEIPMFGQKESFNVVQATAMALFHCRFYV